MTIKILNDFSYTPGPRYIWEGPYSGELFRQSILLKAMKTAIAKDEKLIVDLDGTAGYGRSFFEESFGGLIRIDGLEYDDIISHLTLISEEEPHWIQKIEGYLRKAHGERTVDKKE